MPNFQGGNGRSRTGRVITATRSWVDEDPLVRKGRNPAEDSYIHRMYKSILYANRAPLSLLWLGWLGDKFHLNPEHTRSLLKPLVLCPQ